MLPTVSQTNLQRRRPVTSRHATPASPSHPPRRPLPPLRIQTLGDLRVWRAGTERLLSHTGASQADTLLAWLVTLPGHAIPLSTVWAAFWPQADARTGCRKLTALTTRINRLLGGGAPYLAVQSQHVVFHPGGPASPDTPWNDADRFSLAATTALAGTDPAQYKAALALYTDYLRGYDTPWAQERRQTLKHRWTELYVGLADLHVARGREDLADFTLAEALRHDNLCQPFLLKLLTLRLRTHSLHQVLDCYRLYEAALLWPRGPGPNEALLALMEPIWRSLTPDFPDPTSDGRPLTERGESAAPPASRRYFVQSITWVAKRLAEDWRGRLLTITASPHRRYHRNDLARNLAFQAMAGQDGEGPWFVSLQGLRSTRGRHPDPSLADIWDQLGRALSRQPKAGSGGPSSPLTPSSRGVLVLLDVDHAQAACSEAVRTLLGRYPALRIVITSAIPLALSEESVLPLWGTNPRSGQPRHKRTLCCVQEGTNEYTLDE